MADTFFIKRHDRLPIFRVTLKDNDTPVDLSDAQLVRLLMRNISGLKVAATMTIRDQVEYPGQVEYLWADGDTDTVGQYQAEIEVTWPGQIKSTFPSSGYQIVKVVKDLNDA